MTNEESVAKLFETDMDLDIIDGVQEGWRVWLVFKGQKTETVKMCSAWPPHSEWPDERFEASCVPAYKPELNDKRRRRFIRIRRRVPCGTAPNEDCTCGIYAFKTREDAEAYARREDHFPNHEAYTVSGLQSKSRGITGLVLGRVALWGEVLNCEDHWRGQYAYPQELYLLRGDPKLAPALEARYRIPVLTAQESL